MAIGYTIRWPDLIDAKNPRVINKDIRVVLSRDGGEGWVSPGGEAVGADSLSVPVVLHEEAQPLMNQGGAHIDGHFRLWHIYLSGNREGYWQLNAAVCDLNSGGADTVALYKTNEPAILQGLGTLALPISRAVIGEVKGRIYVLFRHGDEVILKVASDSEKAPEVLWREIVLIRGNLEGWEPNVAQGQEGQGLLKFVLQTARQEPLDRPNPVAEPSSVMLITVDFDKLLQDE